MKAKTHNGTLTIHNPATGNHKTFQIKTQKPHASFAPNERILSLLTGPDNTSCYNSIGIIKDNGKVVMWKKHRSNPVIGQYVNMVMNPEKFEDRAEYLWEGKCRICNRKLTTPESIKTGIGPVCKGKHNV
jgi:hypothetical protein